MRTEEKLKIGLDLVSQIQVDSSTHVSHYMFQIRPLDGPRITRSPAIRYLQE
jgi:hypothetical protein